CATEYCSDTPCYDYYYGLDSW
nr:immunoglobulin heavy chain junction region [Macaca mulatta]